MTDRLLAEAGFVRRLARSLVRDAALADDVAQETMAAGLAQPVAPRSWRDWLATVARRQAGKARAARRVREAHEAAAARERLGHGGREAHAGAGGAGAVAGAVAGAASGAASGAAADETARRLELQQQLTAAVAALAEPYRTVVTLRYFDDLTPRAIAKRSGATAAAVRQQLHRGLAMLRRRLDRECGGRQRWLGAFAAVGLGGVTVPLVPFTLLAMNKLALAAAAVLVAGGVVWMVADPSAVAPPMVPVVEDGAPSVAAAELPMRERRDAELLRSDADAALPKCEVVVLDSAGAPIEGAEVLICDDHGASVEATTDADGVAAKAASGPGMVLARCAGHAPTWRSLDERTGRHVLTLGDGEVVGGVLLVDGAPAKEGTRLGVMPSSSLRHAGAPEGFEKWFYYRGAKEVFVGHDGQFRLQGLPADLNGILWLPSDLWLVPDPGERPEYHHRVPLVARDALTVRTTQLEVFEAKVVWSDDGQPVEGAELLFNAIFDDGSGSQGLGPKAHGGRFRVGLYPEADERHLDWCNPMTRPKVARAWVEASAPGSTPARTFRFEAQDIANGPITIAIDRAHCTCFVARDEQGAPITGARVLTHRISEPTDAEGRGTFAGTRDEMQLIGAPAHLIAATPASGGQGTAADPLVFVLPTDNQIVVRFVGAGGGVPAARFVALRCDHLPFAGRRKATELDRKLYAYEECGWSSGRWLFDVRLLMPRNGDPITLHSIEPDTALTVALLDGMHAEIASERVIAPQMGAKTEVTLQETTRPFAIIGTVVDADGHAIPKAALDISVSAPEQFPPVIVGNVRSDATGAFRLDCAHRRVPLRILVQADGFRPLLEVLPAEQLEQPLRLQLAKGNSVTATVHDPDGIPIDVAVSAHGVHARIEQVTPGVTRMHDLPDGEVQLSVQLGGRVFSWKHDSAQPTASLEVPKLATLQLAAANGWPRPAKQHLILTAHVQCLDRPKEQFTLVPDDPGIKPQQLLPGRYRIELFESAGGASTPLGLTAEVTLTAGETTTATLR